MTNEHRPWLELGKAELEYYKRLYLEETRKVKSHDWLCGCGHWNGANLATCAECGRKPGVEQ